MTVTASIPSTSDARMDLNCILVAGLIALSVWMFVAAVSEEWRLWMKDRRIEGCVIFLSCLHHVR